MTYALNRRAAIAGIGAFAAAGSASATDDGSSPIARGALADNALARTFRQPVSYALPYVRIQTPDGEVDIVNLIKGRTILLSVWAEWCAPCLVELPDLARLQSAYGNDRFAIVPVLSAPKVEMTLSATAELLNKVNAGIFRPAVEHESGDFLVKSVARSGDHEASLPCNLLIAPNGRVVARETGLQRNDATLTADSAQTLWGTHIGEDFAKALAAGFLQ
ncbi:MAG: TlpA family protein disulfide reductase [Proteobacteria bacterium]|nr:TlpA family protein disulfide reductase [Pseudomonadota bacterium]